MMWRRGIDSLSVEVLGRILGQLEEDDLLSASAVCRHWFDIVNSYLLRRNKSAILRPQADDFIPDWRLNSLSLVGFENERLETAKRFCADVKTLYIGYDGVEKRTLDETALAGLLDACLDLRELSFDNVIPTDSMLSIISERGFDDLRSLSFKCASSHSTGTDIERVLEASYFQETSLVLRSCDSDRETSMVVNYQFSFDRPVLCKCIPEQITELRMDCTGLTETAYDSFRFCKNLRSVKLLNAYRIEDDAVISLARLPDMSEICFTDAKNVTSKGWTAVFNSTTVLDITLIRSATGLTDGVLESMSAAAGRCLDIDLQSCKGVTAEGVISMLNTSRSVSVVIDYDERLLDRLAERAALHRETPEPALRVFNVTVQRVHAASKDASVRSKSIADLLSRRFHHQSIVFSYKELFTKVERTHDRIR